MDDLFRFPKKLGFCVFLVHPTVVSVLLSASVERFFVSRMRDFFWFGLTRPLYLHESLCACNAVMWAMVVRPVNLRIPGILERAASRPGQSPPNVRGEYFSPLSGAGYQLYSCGRQLGLQKLLKTASKFGI